MAELYIFYLGNDPTSFYKSHENRERRKVKKERKKWLNGCPVMYIPVMIRSEVSGSHIRNHKEYDSVLSHQWKRKKKSRKQNWLSVTLGFWEILEVRGVLVVLEETPRQSRKNSF